MAVTSNLPIVALVGQTNVGKSSLLNKLAGKRRVVVAKEAHTTRDAVSTDLVANGKHFTLVDTAGLMQSKAQFSEEIKQQTAAVLSSAQVVIMVVDGSLDLNQADQQLARKLLRQGKPVLAVINKADRIGNRDATLFSRLGIADTIKISAKTGEGTQALLNWVSEHISEHHKPTKNEKGVKIGLIGRPNVGKSSLLNTLTQSNHNLVDTVAGTTRDMVETTIVRNNKQYQVADTAGIKRPGKIAGNLEKFYINQSRNAIEWADVVALTLDATEPVTHQDQALAGDIIEAGKALILVVNKSDLLFEPGEKSHLLAKLRSAYQFSWWAPVVFVSATTDKNLNAIFDQADIALTNAKRTIPTAVLNRALAAMILKHPPANVGIGRARLNYVTQTNTQPPTFTFFTGRHTHIHFSYQRFIENELRDKFDFLGTPIKLVFKGKDE